MLNSPLGRATLLVIAAHLLHDADHLRQGRSPTTAVAVTAVLAWVATIVLVILVARRHRLAPLYAAVFGATFSVGFVLVHALPDWGTFSDSYGDANVDALSWVIAAIPFAAGLLLLTAGLRAMRESGRPSPAPA
jgi:hypothetical protein